MKNIKYLIVTLIALTTTVSCVEDDIMESTTPPVVGSVLKLNEIMSKDVNDGPDWIEVYNMSDDDVDISGFILNDKDVADGGFDIPAGTIIQSKGFYLVDEDESGIKVSSGGEDVSLSKPDKTVIDWTKTPDMTASVGLTWAREIDGEGDWMISNATPGASNGSAENVSPILEANPLTEFDDVYAVSASDADGIASVKLVHMINDGVQSIDMALVDGEYKTTVSRAKVGDVVKYYVVATDNTGLQTYYPEDGSTSPAEFTVAGGVEEMTFSEKSDVDPNIFEFTFVAKVHYTDQVDEVRLYYLLPGEQQDEDNGFDDKHSIKNVPLINGLFKATIADLAKGTELKYYMRVEYLDGTKTYYPLEVEGGDFNHDLGTTWPMVTVGEIPIAPVNGFSDLVVTNDAGADLKYDVNVAYENGIEEVKFYYIINYDPATYVEDNDRHSMEWEGELPTGDNMYNFAIPTADLAAGDKVSWYMRAKDGEGDKMYYTFGKTSDEFDGDIKDDPATWSVVVKE